MKMEAIFEQTHKLPTIPKVVQELIDSFNQEDVDIGEIGRKIALDQVITAKVLRLANSAHYGAARQIGTIEEAVIVLGFNTLRTLVVASGVTGAFVATPGFDRQKFWQRSVAVASTAKWLGKFAKINPDGAFTAGLIHNIGELLIHIVVPEIATKIDAAVKSGANRVSLEDVQIGFDYVMVGEELTRRWNFPAETQQAIKFQATPLTQQPFSKLSGVLHLAIYLTDALDDNIPAADIVQDCPAEVVEKLGLDIESIVEGLPEAMKMGSELSDMLSR
ncbi:HDOD domain-containing protein [Parachitinimonas caeni]|uniref:HDOD domain-containing protein n=1 Tax=Parachitinimonas caeni TaxID=3031301 RepID=A0ABT7DZL4_9NEIS|nr:HDOD domain-containing protein [Parachitinimonas caeni]MDK2125506.1 HDOD domain-containing protein [Parachitinimonas caeni]